MRFQLYEWSCGAASSSNALKQFGINIPERQIIPVAGTTPPSKCSHCVKVNKLLEERECDASSYWKCPCEECREVRREWKKECDSGTSPEGILAALRRYGGPRGLKASEYQSESKNDAWQWIHGSLIHGRVVILCVDSWRHWVVAFAGAGDRVSIFDPYPSKKNLKQNGVETLTKDDLMRKWWNTRQWVGKEKRLYAISIGKL